MIADPYPTVYYAIYERCVCNQRITRYPYYGVLRKGEDEDAIVWIDGYHEECLGEWGLLPDDSELGIAHAHYNP